jgi:hypothetical protein
MMNIGQILNGDGATDTLNSRYYEPYVEHQGHSFCSVEISII